MPEADDANRFRMMTPRLVHRGEAADFTMHVELDIEPKTRVRITIEPLARTGVKVEQSFLGTAQSLQLDRPPDWSDRIDEYLYGNDVDGRH